MAYLTRSLDEISKTVRGAFRQYLPGTDASLAQNVLYVIAKAVTLLAREYELRFGWLSRQMFLSSADGDAWVARHAGDVGIWRKPAASASGMVTGSGLPSTAYPAGVRFSSGGNTFVSTASVVTDAEGAVSIPVVAEQSGASTNRDADAVMLLTDPSLNPTLASEFAVAVGGLGGGADVETTASLRARALFRKRYPPRAGALSDYEELALNVPGVICAWAFRVSASPGAVTVLFLFAGRTNSIPLSGDVAAVQAAIDARRLIRVDAGEASAPVALPVNVTISGLATDTADVRAAIEASIRAMFIARCRPGIAGNTFTVSRSWISEAISTASGEDRHVITAPAADITLTGGQFPVLGVVTYA
nr:baseplate J/gp47 family protein [Mesorhizobium sp.]